MSVFDRIAQRVHEMKGDEQSKLQAAYLTIFNTPLGEMVMKDLKRYVDHGKDVYYPGGNVNDTVFLSGQQSVVNYILGILEGGK